MNIPQSHLSAAPLESPFSQTQAGSYLDYWPEQLKADRSLAGAKKLGLLALAGSEYVRNPDKNRQVVGLVPEDKRDTAGIIEMWDRSLGSFNPLTDAGSDLLRGAALILQENKESSAPAVPDLPGGEVDIVDIFLEVADRLDPEEQKPSPALLTAGQLVHKAAWVEPDTDRQQDLFKTAGTMYGRIHDDPAVAWDETKLKAAEYQADIHFHELSGRIRQARSNHEDMDSYRAEAIDLLRGQIGDLFQVGRLANTSESPREGAAWSGRMFELFASIAIRDQILVGSPLKGNHSEVRTAFSSEDQPREPFERQVESSFDIIIDKVTSNNKIMESTPVQLKLGSSQQKRPRPYHPAIQVVEVKNMGSRRMMATGEVMLHQYAEKEFERGVGVLSELQKAIAPLLTKSKTKSQKH